MLLTWLHWCVRLCFGAKMTVEKADWNAKGLHGSSQNKTTTTTKAISKLTTIHSAQSGMQLTIRLTCCLSCDNKLVAKPGLPWAWVNVMFAGRPRAADAPKQPPAFRSTAADKGVTSQSSRQSGRCGVWKQWDTVACYACSSLDMFNCMISVLISFFLFLFFVCKIRLEQVLHDLSITMPFVTTESILFWSKSNSLCFLALIYFVCMIMMCQRFVSSAIFSVI